MLGVLLEFLNKGLNLIFDHLLMVFIINIKEPSINSKYFHIFLSTDPFLMSLMNASNVLNTDIFLTLSISDLNSLKTYFR